MRAARLAAPRKFEFLDLETPKPADGECLVRLEQLSVCGSDIRLEYECDLPEDEYPMVPGRPCHECAGVVVESRTPEFKEGQRVIVIPKLGAGMAEYVTQTAERLIALPNWGPLDEWVMCQHSGTVLFSAKRWGNPAGKRIGVLGQGGIGLSFTMLAEKQGASQVVAFDLYDYRLDKATQFGATHTVNPDRDNAAEAVEEITGGAGLDFMVDASGDPDGLETCIRLVKRFGTVISFSLISTKKASFSHFDWMVRGVTIIPTVIAATPAPVQEIREMVALKERGWMDPGKLKTHSRTWEQIPEAFEMYANRRDGVIKVAIAV